MVFQLSVKRNTFSVCLLALTVMSVFFLSYSIYIILETALAVRSLTVSLLPVSIEGNESEADFHLIIGNPSVIPLKLFFYSIHIYFNDTHIAKKQANYREPLPLPSHKETNLTIAVTLNNQTFYSDGVWRLNVRFLLETPLPQKAGYTTTLVK